MTTNIPLIFTDSAARKVAQLMQEEGDLSLKLRVFITGGGCSGFQYGFTFENVINPDDTVIEKHVRLKDLAHSDDDEEEDGGEEGGGDKIGVNLLVDPMSFQYLRGAEIDYKEDVQGSQFIIRNPNAKTTCGCGSSFAI